MTIVDQLLPATPPPSGADPAPRREDGPPGAFASALSDAERTAAPPARSERDSWAEHSGRPASEPREIERDTDGDPGGRTATTTGRADSPIAESTTDAPDAAGDGGATASSAESEVPGGVIAAHAWELRAHRGNGDVAPRGDARLEHSGTERRTTVPFGIRHLVAGDDPSSTPASAAEASRSTDSLGEDLAAPATPALGGANAVGVGAADTDPRSTTAAVPAEPTGETRLGRAPVSPVSRTIAAPAAAAPTTNPGSPPPGVPTTDTVDGATPMSSAAGPDARTRPAPAVASDTLGQAVATAVHTALGEGEGPVAEASPPRPTAAATASIHAPTVTSAGRAEEQPPVVPADRVARVVLDRSALADAPTPSEADRSAAAGVATVAREVGTVVRNADGSTPTPLTGSVESIDGSSPQHARDATSAAARPASTPTGSSAPQGPATPMPTDTATTDSVTPDGGEVGSSRPGVGSEPSGRRVIVSAADPSGSADDMVAPELRTPDVAATRQADATGIARGTDHAGRAAEQLAWRELFDRIERQRSSIDGGLELEIVTERFGTIRVEAAEARDGIHLSLRGDGAGHRELAELAAELRQQFGRGGGAFADVDVDDGSGSASTSNGSATTVDDDPTADDRTDPTNDGHAGLLGTDGSGLDLHL